MQEFKNLFCATWGECVWSIADASKSTIKFILSDHPITVFNEMCYPGTPSCSDFLDPDIRKVATYTLFPFSKNKIIILTNLSWVRNPYQNPERFRPNPRLFGNSVTALHQIQTGRELCEQEVININLIIKQRAYRYIAAEKEEWLYPELNIQEYGWRTLAQRDLLMPDPRSVSFSTQIIIGYTGGGSSVSDEYGRTPYSFGYGNENARFKERETFLRHQGEYAKRHGPKRRGRSFEFHRLDNAEDSPEIHAMHLNYLKMEKSN